MERLTGLDALMYHMEGADTPMHTLKVAVLDTSRRGRPVTLRDLIEMVPPYLGVVPRATQRVVAVPGFGGRPFWVDDQDFDIGAHLDEMTLPGAGGRQELDRACAVLSAGHLDRDRPLWKITLVHGLEGGRQAVVVCMHHAIGDGMAALNTFLAVTAEEAGSAASPLPARPTVEFDHSALRRRAWRDLGQLVTGVGDVAGEFVRSRRRASTFTERHHLPRPLRARRTVFNTPSGGSRVCASGNVELAQLKLVGKTTGATINGVLHALIATAIRGEFLSRGESVARPAVATFGVASDTKSPRRWGNSIATASVSLHIQIEDPESRLRATARSCLHGVELRRTIGFEMTSRLAVYGARLAPRLRELAARHTPRVVNHITTANVPGPNHQRWVGDVAVVDWISFAVAVSPADVNLTAYSYDGRMSIGLVATPESMPDPASFLARLQPALDELLDIVAERAVCA